MDRRGFLGLAAGAAYDRGAPERVMPPAGGRVTRSTTEYLANNSVFNVLDFGARRDGSDDGPAIRRALDAAAAAQGTLLFPPGTYSYARSPNFAQHNLEIIGQGRVTLRHTGQGPGFVADGWIKKFGRRVWNMRIENLILEGNPNTTVGFLFRSIHHGRFVRLRVTGGAAEGEGFRTEFFIANYCESWCVSGSEPIVGTLPATGITLSSLAAPKENLSTVDCTLTNFIVEGCARVGVHLDRAQNNLIRGGTFEDNRTGTGLLLSEMASGNVVDGVFLESNQTHIDCRGPQNQFLALSAAKGLCRFHGGASFSRLIGGRFHDLAIEDGVRDVKLLGHRGAAHRRPRAAYPTARMSRCHGRPSAPRPRRCTEPGDVVASTGAPCAVDQLRGRYHARRLQARPRRPHPAARPAHPCRGRQGRRGRRGSCSRSPKVSGPRTAIVSRCSPRESSAFSRSSRAGVSCW